MKTNLLIKRLIAWLMDIFDPAPSADNFRMDDTIRYIRERMPGAWCLSAGEIFRRAMQGQEIYKRRCLD